MTVCRKNLHHGQKFQKQAHNKGVKPRSYGPNDKVWLNSKYIKTKWNRKLEAKFFEPFQVLHPVGKQAYKLKLPKKWRVHNMFHVSLLEQDTSRKGRVSEEVPELEDGDKDSETYKVEAIQDRTVYARESEGLLSGLYYLVSWKNYPKEENTWEPVLAVQYHRKLISLFHKDDPEKPIATSLPVNFTPLIARPTVIKRKQGQPANSANK